MSDRGSAKQRDTTGHRVKQRSLKITEDPGHA